MEFEGGRIMPAVISIDGTTDTNVVMVTMDRKLLEQGSECFRNFDEAAGNLIVQKCFAIPGVSEVRVRENRLQVSRERDGDWKIIVPALKRVLNFHFERQKQRQRS